MEKIKNKLFDIRRKWMEAFPTIFVSLFLFLTVLKFFGISEVIIVSFLTLTFRVRSKQGFNLRELLKCYLIQLIIFAAAFAAVQNLILCISLNLLIPFAVVYMLTDKFNPKAYFVYGMEFVFLQLRPFTAQQIPNRLFALLYSYTFITLALFFYAQIIKKRRHYGTVRKGMHHMAVQLEKLADGKYEQADASALMQMIYHLNQVIYSSRNYNYLATGYGTVNYYFIIIFQRFLYLTKKLAGSSMSVSEQNKSYLLKVSKSFYAVEKQINQTDNTALIAQIKVLIQDEGLDSPRLNEGMKEILELLCYALWKITDVSKNKAEKAWKIPPVSHKLKGIRVQFCLSQFHMRYALRLALVLCISFTFCRATNLEHSYWYPMSAFLMLMPYAEESTMKMNNRMIGTIAGLSITYFLTQLFQTLPAHIVIILIMTCLMYYASVTSWTMTMYSTCYGMALTTLSLPRGEAIELRFIYVLAAVITVLLANRFVLPNTAKAEFLKDINALIDIDQALVREVKKGRRGDQNLLRDLYIRYNLSAEEIKTYINQHLDKDEQKFYQQLLPINRQLISEIEQINSYMLKYDLSPKDSFIIEKVLENMEQALEELRKSYTGKELHASVVSCEGTKIYGPLDEQLYFNHLAVSCLKTVQDMVELFSGQK